MSNQQSLAPNNKQGGAGSRISVHVPAELKERLQHIAHDQHRTLSGQVVLYLARAVENEEVPAI